MVAQASDVGEWILSSHDVPVAVRIEPNPSAAAAFDAAFEAYSERGKALYCGRSRKNESRRSSKMNLGTQKK
jgi:hypothetical protein